MVSTRELFHLDGRVAIVTGGDGRIGAAVCRALSGFGAIVLSAEPGGGTGAEGAARGLDMDIRSDESVTSGVRLIVEEFGAVNILVNCAYPRTDDWGAAPDKVTQDSWRLNVDWHMGGYFTVSRACAEAMKSHGGGSIVNLASIYGVVGPDFSLYEGTEMGNAVAYAAIKGGIIAFTRYLSTYYGAFGVRANCVSPGGIFAGQPAEFVERYEARTPLGRMATPQDVVGAVLLLASDAGAYITGQNIIVDGGWTAW